MPLVRIPKTKVSQTSTVDSSALRYNERKVEETFFPSHIYENVTCYCISGMNGK